VTYFELNAFFFIMAVLFGIGLGAAFAKDTGLFTARTLIRRLSTRPATLIVRDVVVLDFPKSYSTFTDPNERESDSDQNQRKR
jgi:hypothetical protein